MQHFLRTLLGFFILLAVTAPMPAAENCTSTLAITSSPSTVMIPVLTTGLQGADGSVWDTEVWLANVTDEKVVFAFGPCTVSCCCEEFATHWPQTTERLHFINPHGRWFMLPEDGSLQLQARFRDRTRAPLSAGIELPVVRQADFRTDEINLLGVPSDPGVRSMLRFYALEPNVELTVELIDAFGTVFHSTPIALEDPEHTFAGAVPAYAQSSIPPSADTGSHFRVRVTSSNGGQCFWAFASVTNNVTSEVTLITPSW